MTSGLWQAPTIDGSISATITMPGSKSQTNRALVLAALAAREGGTSTVSGALRSRDTDLMIGALHTLGFDVTGDGTDVTVSPGAGDGHPTTVDCGLAGTVLRFLPPVAALRAAPTVFDGDEQARARPIAPLLDALRSIGVGVDGQHLPFTVAGAGQVRGGEVGVDASGSSQFVSGLLLSGAAFTHGLRAVNTADVLPSGPHVVMTVTMLREAGIAVDDSTPGRWHIDPQPIPPHQWVIEPDLSNALAFIAPALATGGTVRITGWPRQSTQPARQIEDVVRQFAQTASLTDDYLEVTGQTGYGAVDLDLGEVGELTPTVAALAALAEPGSVSILRGIAHLRGHETDRLKALAHEINALGGQCEETEDGLRIVATGLHGGVWGSYADHRMATAGALVGLKVPGVSVDDIATTSKTLPDFPGMWADMLTQSGGRAS
ncbi:3-phosphoshikimate 1-carboxyvinyltransferase [Mycobacteroides franklinii]|uniref:3-phosphoshikimate 1-carboxyvinyltransferase n=1 Tax=Mycobacteroides franklinii TaxID=948102 RepID=A0A4V3HV44_9MYCO|nr:3-phosphoshikimate 1-carboxyvinyltransferase [Mycobacteroides franklinii]TDZ43198.1 3-phosphoshikimate 1-carboxyvinyltransferase [Mycobacteroides franklinii]TDZ50333.1 3-phosphoshikimate 1-carboxyvinyltransferase [Mycobacteroides franklinii]TDZ56753.1 3-phosphoshikimate 1-carboxyvinyltransferase [Mycobacteroides franklinii]TDZ63694.1 3-phosphoshikimate 1-carboxyvinyltransferase [Mycobacteroides franklinii]TDZ70091.1 3-phosphoshikimate 1-carboxyvinyltransferase [Mycobacteroides franklinii]